MKIRLNRPLTHDRLYEPGVYEFADDLARQFVQMGIAEPVIAERPVKATADNKAADAPLAGSPTGEDKPASSSGAARAPRKSGSRKG
jgi:hypothetical protein